MVFEVVYFTVLGHFVLLFIFLVRGSILPGAVDGIKYYVTPDLGKLKDTKTKQKNEYNHGEKMADEYIWKKCFEDEYV
ncbi:hypothetical protein DPMN_148684 [Dreissena polymorpha]|uniref:Uncharacterized protein n=1 Tax=Dreissena polymorpha TaxID=45954 RepID=A0A9D4FFZ9_DREPO|nr:hypothetical protein DPMN_148684 [Dreissena polymorpha]